MQGGIYSLPEGSGISFGFPSPTLRWSLYMKDYLERCNYCIGKAIESETITENDYYEGTEAMNKFKPAFPIHDNHNIFVFYACEDCEKKQKEKYDPIIFNDYTAYEQKVQESGERFEPE